MKGCDFPREFESEILDAREMTHDVKIVRASVPEGFFFRPGQYVSLSVTIDGKKIRVPYSIASTPEKKYVELCVRRIENGRASNRVWNLRKGDEVEFFGPLGRFGLKENRERDLFFVCTGTGISPFVSMISWALKKGFGKKMFLVKGFREERDVLYEKEFSALREKYGNFGFCNVLSSAEGHVQDSLEKFVPKNPDADFYLCGLSEMIKSVKERLGEMGVGEDRMFFEKYD